MSTLQVLKEENPVETKKINKIHFAIILDESGSMSVMKQQAIEALNSQLEIAKTKENDYDTKMYFISFSSTSKPEWESSIRQLRWDAKPSDVDFVSSGEYMPNGGTAMLDAVGYMITELQNLPDANEEDTAFVVIIISDGAENSSIKWSWNDIAEKIQECQSTDRWTFVYEGANQDLSKISAKMSIPLSNMSSFDASASGLNIGNFQRKAMTSCLYAAFDSGETRSVSAYSGITEPNE